MRFHPVLLLIALLVACAHPPTPSPTAVSQALATPTTTPTPSHTPTLPPTHTATRPGTPSATVTPFPSHTPTATLTPTPPMAPAGTIYFFWSPDTFDPFATRHDNLYLAVPQNSPENWIIEPILTDLVIGHATLSPDGRQFAFNKWDDTDGNGAILPQFEGDISNLYIFSLSNYESTRLTYNLYSSYGFSWLPDNQTLVYDQYGNFEHSDLFQINTIELLSHKLAFDFNATTDDMRTYLYYPHISPNGEFLITNYKTGYISPNGGLSIHSDTPLLINRNDYSLTTIDTTIISPTELQWSPNGQFIAMNSRYSAGLNVVDVNSMKLDTLVLPEFLSLFAWSFHNQQLAFTQTKLSTPSGDVPISTLKLWSSELVVAKSIFQANYISQPVWTSNDSQFATGFLGENDGGILFVDVQTENVIQLWRGDHIEEIYSLAWSPDSEWLLFFSQQVGGSGMYVIHKNGGEPYLIWETMGGYAPNFVYWLP